MEAAKPWGMTLPRLEKTYSVKDAWGNSHTARAFFGAVWIRNCIWDDVRNSLHTTGEEPIKLALGESGLACVDLNEGQAARTKTKRGRVIGALLAKWWHGAKTRAADPRRLVESTVATEPKLNPRTSRLSLPHLPLLGLRALCLNAVALQINCTSEGGRLVIQAPDPPPRETLP